MSNIPSSALNTFAIHLAGGIPVHRDIAPSIIFVVAFALLVPVALWRVMMRSSRTLVLLRPCIFIVVRIVTFVFRAIEGNGNYSTGVITAEQICLSIGSIFLIEPLVTLTARLLESYSQDQATYTTTRRGKLRRTDHVGVISRLLQVVLLLAIILSIYAATKIGDAINNASDANTVRTLRRVVALIIAGEIIIVAVVLFYGSVTFGLPYKPVGYLLVCCAFLGVAAAYRLLNAFYVSAISVPVAFWLALVLPEWIVTVIYLSVNLNVMFPVVAPPPAAVDTQSAYPLTSQYPQAGYPQAGYSQPYASPNYPPPKPYQDDA